MMSSSFDDTHSVKNDRHARLLERSFIMSPEAKARRRANRRLGKQGTDRKNSFGVTDLTPFIADKRLKKANKQQ